MTQSSAFSIRTAPLDGVPSTRVVPPVPLVYAGHSTAAGVVSLGWPVAATPPHSDCMLAISRRSAVVKTQWRVPLPRGFPHVLTCRSRQQSQLQLKMLIGSGEASREGADGRERKERTGGRERQKHRGNERG